LCSTDIFSRKVNNLSIKASQIRIHWMMIYIQDPDYNTAHTERYRWALKNMIPISSSTVRSICFRASRIRIH
jgi:hypothetical protein